MRTQIPILTFLACLLIMIQGRISAQEIENVLVIEEVPITKKEFKSLQKAKHHQEHEVLIRRVNSTLTMVGTNAFVMVY